MKIQCDVCEQSEASVLCCADEAALCVGCDEMVHAANQLAGKHHRVPLMARSASKTPVCDICQEKPGYFFCLEDRALLCRQCDLSIHTASPYVTAHQRFLITGVQVALQSRITNDCNNSNISNGYSTSGNCNCSNNARSSLVSTDSAASKKLRAVPNGDAVGQEMNDFKSQQWSWNEIFDGVEFDQCY